MVIDPAPSPAATNPTPAAATTGGPEARAGGGHGERARDACGRTGGSPASPSIFEAMALDVDVTVSNALVLRGDSVKIGGEGLSLGDLNMTLGGELQATKKPGASTMIVGNIRTVRGFYEFQAPLRIAPRRHRQLQGRTRPTRSRRDRRARRVGRRGAVRVHGEAQRLELEPSSTPPLTKGTSCR